MASQLPIPVGPPGFIPTVRQPTHNSSGSVSSDPKNTLNASRPKRRNRLITSCLECRRRKLKCDKGHPCSNCEKFARDCIFLAAAPNSTSQHRLAAIKDQVASLEKLLERDAQSSFLDQDAQDAQDAADFNIKTEDPESDEGEELEASPFAIRHSTYDDRDTADEAMDLGFKFGKLRMSDRVGGFFRPTMEDELGYVLDTDPGRVKLPISPQSLQPTLSSRPSHDSAFGEEVPDYLLPDKDFCCPSSGIALGAYGLQGQLLDCLPIRIVSDRLVERYFVAVHPIISVVHQPTFERAYSTFWDEIDLGFEPPNSTQAKMLAVLFAATLSLDDKQCIAESGLEKLSLLSTLKLGTESALVRAHFMRTTRVETLQALVIYLAPQCRAVVSRAHTSLISMTVRLAECMGLQKDPEVYNFLPVETQIRRSLWFNICFLDSRSDYAHGPRPLIRTDEYDVKYPLNLEDTSITSQQTALKPSTGWTTKLLLIMRAEGDEKSRWLGFERMKVEKKQAKVGSVLRELEVFRRQFEAKYYPLLDERQPLQRLARLAGTIITSRLYVGLLHRYLTTPNGLTPRLRRMLIDACLVLIESGKALETETCLQPWKWYAGTWQQYHSSFLLLFDAWFYPSSAEADRIWNALDWAFDCDRSLGRAEKARGIMRSLRERSVVYKTFRKCKPPTSASREIIKTVAERLDRTDVRRSPGSPDDGVSILQASSLGGENPERMANGSIAPADTPLFEYMSNPQDPSIQSYHGSNPRLVSAYSSSGSSQVSQYGTVSPVHTASYGQPRVPTRGMPQSYPPPPQPQPPLPATPSDPREQMMSMFGDMPPGGQVGHDELMNDFDWNEWDSMFPPNQFDFGFPVNDLQ